jgi:hypothetical protein
MFAVSGEIMSVSVRFLRHAEAIPDQSGRTGSTGMEALIAIFAIVTPWLVLDVLARRHGVDSRDTLPDDHRR